MFTTSYSNFFYAKFGHHIWRHNSCHVGEMNTNQKVIYHSTFLSSFVTFDAFYFCLWPKTLISGGCGRKSPSNRPPCLYVQRMCCLVIQTTGTQFSRHYDKKRQKKALGRISNPLKKVTVRGSKQFFFHTQSRLTKATTSRIWKKSS